MPVFGLAAEVFRSVDENGVVVFSDRPKDADAQRVFVATPGGQPQARNGNAQNDAGDDGRDVGSEALNGEMPRDPTPEERAEERNKNCSVAQERAERYRISRRLYRNLPNGEREYLSDAELDEAKARAEADVANWCD
jgi:hypothetical protein